MFITDLGTESFPDFPSLSHTAVVTVSGACAMMRGDDVHEWPAASGDGSGVEAGNKPLQQWPEKNLWSMSCKETCPMSTALLQRMSL